MLTSEHSSTPVTPSPRLALSSLEPGEQVYMCVVWFGGVCGVCVCVVWEWCVCVGCGVKVVCVCGVCGVKVVCVCGVCVWGVCVGCVCAAVMI